MAIVTLDEAKAHLRVDGPDDDADIGLKLAAAEDLAAQLLNRPLPWTDGAGAVVPVPAAVKAAILLILGDLYASREAMSAGLTLAENPTLGRLLAPYRRICLA
ncbi:head-tail connector protein [Azospirillum sp. sgz302134]